MKNTKKTLVCLAAAVCIIGCVVLLAAGGSKSKKLIGTWYDFNGNLAFDITKDYFTYESEQSCSYFIGNDKSIHIDATAAGESKEICIRYDSSINDETEDYYDCWNYTGGVLYFDGHPYTKNP